MQAISQRDKIALAIGTAAILFFLLAQFLILPLMDERKRLRRGIETRQQSLVEMRELQIRFQELQVHAEGLRDRFAVRPPDFSLFAFLDQAAAEAKIKEHIAYMKPSESADAGQFRESMVEMKLQEVGIGQLVNFLKRIESPEMIVLIKRIAVQENKKAVDTLDAIMQVATFEKPVDGLGEQ